MFNSSRRGALRSAVGAMVIGLGLTFSGSATQAETVLKAVPHSDLKILDPIWTTAYITRNHGYMVYDTLFSLDTQGNIQPQMVDTVTTSEDGLTVTMTLRDGLVWHDGAPVTAADCVASINRWGSKDAMGQKMMSFVESLEATDDKTITFKLSTPTGLVTLALAKPSSNVPFMMPERVASTPSSEQIADYTGSGPFVFRQDLWEPGTKIVYEKFDGYVPRSEPASGLSGGKIAKVDVVEWLPIRDHQQAVNALKAGEIDFIEAPPHDLLPLLKDDPNITLDDFNPAGNQFTFRFNVLHPPFDNPKMRQALLYAFNQEDFVQAVVGNEEYYELCLALFGCGLPFESTAAMDGLLESNFAKARELIAESGYNGEPILLMHSTDLAVLTNLAPVAKDLMEAVGLNVDMQSMDWQTLVARRAKRDAPADGGWNAFITSWTTGDLFNPVAAAFLNSSCDTALFGWPCDTRIEELRDAFARATSVEEQKKIVDEVQAAWYDYPTHIHLGQWTSRAAMTKNVSGLLQTGAAVFWNLEKN